MARTLPTRICPGARSWLPIGAVRACAWLVLLCCTATPPLAAAADPQGCLPETTSTRIERGLAGNADLVDLPGTSIGIVHRGRLVHDASFGFADRARQIPASADTLYNLASVTKPFTATLAFLLAEDGVIDLDAPIARYLDPSQVIPVDMAGDAITARHLVNHTAGLPKNPPNRRNQATGSVHDPGIWATYSVAELRAALAATTLEAPVGTRFDYSNYGYGLLGHVLESAAGRPYEMLLRERLLAPLGMRDTAITLAPALQARLAAHYWSEDLERREQTVRAQFGEVAAFIGLSSSVRDLSRFVAAQLGHGGESNPVPASVAEGLRTVSGAADEDGPYRYEMAPGWQRLTRVDGAGEAIFMHAGEVDGHTAGLFLVPGHDLGVIVLQNLGGVDGAESIERVGQWLIRVVSPDLDRCGS